MEVVYVPKAAQFIEDLPNPLDARTKKTLDLLEALGHTLHALIKKRNALSVKDIAYARAVQKEVLADV